MESSGGGSSFLDSFSWLADDGAWVVIVFIEDGVACVGGSGRSREDVEGPGSGFTSTLDGGLALSSAVASMVSEDKDIRVESLT